MAVVYFTRDLSAEGLCNIYQYVNQEISGRIGIKLHTGEPYGPNIIPVPWVKKFIKEYHPNADIVETNTAYKGERFTTEQHRKTLHINGWDQFPVVIMDAYDTVDIPVPYGNGLSS